MALFTFLPDNITIYVDRLSSFTVLNDMYETTSCAFVHVPDGMLCSILAEYAECETEEDFVLHGNNNVIEAQMRTLDWCGVDMSRVYTARQLREKHKLELVQMQDKHECVMIAKENVTLRRAIYMLDTILPPNWRRHINIDM
jgi:hypothetical protein